VSGLALAISPLAAREFRVPTPLERAYAFSHYPFPRPDTGQCWYFDMFAAGLYRTADRAYLNKNTTKKESLAGIFFGAPSFTLSQALVPGSFSPTNPLLSIATITPTFEYRERTAYFGMFVEREFGCDGNWHVGARVRLPFRDIRTELDSCCDLIDTNLEDMVRTQNEIDIDELCEEGVITNAFAYRLDFLSQLPLVLNSTAPNNRFVNYNGPVGGDIYIGGINVTNANAQIPVHVIERSDGTPPLFPAVDSFARRLTEGVTECDPTPVDLLPVLAPDGSGLANNERAVFDDAVNYAPLGASTANQAQLWVVPTLNGTVAANTFDLVPDARTIQSRFNAIINNISSDINTLLAANNFSFQTQHSAGVGDLDTELYVRRDWCNWCWCNDLFAEGIFGVRFPTGRRNTTPNNALLVRPGNNRHFEIKLGGLLGAEVTNWLAIKADAWYSWALKRKERVAAPFQGATIKNVGPTIDADISWGYFVGDLDFTMILPWSCAYTGVNVGYQAYVKRKDRVSLDVTTAVDFIGNTQPLDADVLEIRTKQVAHSVKAEVFRQCDEWQFFAGFNHAFAGKNAPNQSDWYLGFFLYF